MLASFTSTRSINEANRFSILKLQNQLVTAQQEVATGRHADIGVTLGGRTSDTVSLRQEFSRLTTLVATNSTVKTRLDFTQTTLQSFSTAAGQFGSTLIASRDTDIGPAVAQGEAQANLVTLMDGLNSTLGGEYVFGGINTTQQPITNYYATPTPANRQAVIDAFTTAFGVPPGDPAAAGISKAAMQSFLDGPFSDLFEEPAWSADWSSASDQNLQSRISTTEQVESSTNANQIAYRKLAKAYVMVADLGVQALNKETYTAIVDSAMTISGQTIQDLAKVQAKLGTSAARVSDANDRMTTQQSIMTSEINNLESVDPFEAAIRVNTLVTQLQTAFALTARVQNLTILNFL
jgi:flagellar hook-associated protein 3 FlgL